ncbi:MAG TPA: GAF domain-containing protein, partial [Myxococcus sp.]|nr:GAF domain-containing protein [Myxococcus sp.]
MSRLPLSSPWPESVAGPAQAAGPEACAAPEGGAEARIAFLARAGELLSSSLEWRTVLQRLAELSVRMLADWCAVDVLHEDGRVERAAAAHREPEQVALVQELFRLAPVDLERSGGVSQVLRTGETLCWPEVPDALLEKLARNEAQLEVARRLGLRAGLLIPLMARGRVLGALSLIRCREGARYEDVDFALARELARRASLSMANALLYA